MRLQSIRPKYVEFMPRELEHGVFYISERFATASHLCCCGCGTKIVTPLRKTEYTLADRHGLVSIRPSIGNWNYPCQSHYLITDNRVVWAGTMTAEQIRKGREQDDALREAYLATVAWPWWRRAGSRVKRWLRALFK